MNRKKQMMLAIAAAALLVVLALSAGLRNPEEPTVAVMIVNQDVPAGSVLKAEQLKQVDIPERLMITGYIQDGLQAVGRSTDHDLSSGQIIDRKWLHDQPSGIVYPAAMSDGRLYTLRLAAEHANGFWLATGNKVDVHIIPRAESEQELPDVLAGIEIAALIGVDQEAESGAATSVLASPSSSGSALVCLHVNSAQAHALAIAESRCTIKLIPINEPSNNGRDAEETEIPEASYSRQARFD